MINGPFQNFHSIALTENLSHIATKIQANAIFVTLSVSTIVCLFADISVN